MCDDTWQRMDADFDRIIGGLKVALAERQGSPSRAHHDAQGGKDAVILEWKRTGPKPRQVEGGKTTKPVGETVLRQTVPLRVRR